MVMTSNVFDDENPLKCALGKYPEIQYKALNNALHLLKTMKFSGRPKKFLYGGIIAIKATMALHEDLRDNYGIPYLKTVVLNQCWVERTFGYVRDMNGSDRHPSALHMLYRLKRMVTDILLSVSYL